MGLSEQGARFAHSLLDTLSAYEVSPEAAHVAMSSTPFAEILDYERYRDEQGRVIEHLDLTPLVEATSAICESLITGYAKSFGVDRLEVIATLRDAINLARIIHGD